MWSPGGFSGLVMVRSNDSVSPELFGLVNVTVSSQFTPNELRSLWAHVALLYQSSCATTTSSAGVMRSMFTSIAVSVLGLTKFVVCDVLPHWTWVFGPLEVSVIRQFWMLPLLSQLERLVNDPPLLPTIGIA